eukprot:1511999-Prymnesium_polylepis.1
MGRSHEDVVDPPVRLRLARFAQCAAERDSERAVAELACMRVPRGAPRGREARDEHRDDSTQQVTNRASDDRQLCEHSGAVLGFALGTRLLLRTRLLLHREGGQRAGQRRIGFGTDREVTRSDEQSA